MLASAHKVVTANCQLFTMRRRFGIWSGPALRADGLALRSGVGGGSIASWLCQRVGNHGRVLATDIEPCFLRTLSFNNLEVRQHDIRVEGLPEGEFDLAQPRTTSNDSH